MLLKSDIETSKKVIQEIKVEISEIKSEIQKPTVQEFVNSGAFLENQSVMENSRPAEISPMKILGELLSFLRREKSMSALMLARQISKIEIDGKVAVIFSDDDEIQALQKNDRFRADITNFFESKGLSFKIHENEKQVTEVDELKHQLGKKLVIK